VTVYIKQYWSRRQSDKHPYTGNSVKTTVLPRRNISDKHLDFYR